MNQLTLGVSFDLGNYTVVFAVNSNLSVRIPKDYRVEIAKELELAGVTTVAGKVKFPAKGVVSAIIIADPTFSEVQVRLPTPDIMAACVASARLDKAEAEFGEKIGAFVDRLNPDGEMVKLLALVGDDEAVAYLKAAWARISSVLSQIDPDKITEELQALAKKSNIPAPEADKGD